MSKEKKIWISVDGGGSKTRLCASDLSGKKVFDRTYGSSNYKASSKDKAEASLRSAIEDLFDKLGLTSDNVVGMVAGVAGCDSDIDKQVYTEIIRRAGLNSESVCICNDTELVFRGRSDESGICAVAGTGSIVTAYDMEKLLLRLGGWGSPLSDQGSGYWIGARILTSMLRWMDGLEESPQAIYSDIKDKFDAPGVVLQWKLAGLSTREVASLAPLVFRYADQGDPSCLSIVEESIRFLIELIVTAYHKAAIKDRCSIVTVGGLFDNEYYRQSVMSGVEAAVGNQNIAFYTAGKSPAEDGLRYARKRFPIVN